MARPLHTYRNDEELQLARAISKSMYRYDHLVESRIPDMNHLTDEHVKQFWQEGYLVLDQLLNQEEVDRSIEAIMDIVWGRTIGPKVQFVRPVEELKSDEERELAIRKLADYINHEPRLKDIAYHESIMELTKRLYNEETKVVQDMAILKPPTGGAEKPWHQDMAYGPLAYTRPVVGVWIALDEATLDNGCMHVIPRSHMEGGVPHYAERDWQLCDTNVEVDRDVAVPLKPGGVLLFHGLLHHGTPPNFSNKRRRALQFHYAPQSIEKMTPREYKRMFTNEITGAEC